MPSTVIRARSYDAGTSRLTITFVTGRIYVYEDVPPSVVAALNAATSKGRFFNQHIRDCYRYREITLGYQLYQTARSRRASSSTSAPPASRSRRSSARSPDGAQRNPGSASHAQKGPGLAALHPGYSLLGRQRDA
jgi:lysyl-tRNA synthetase class 2